MEYCTVISLKDGVVDTATLFKGRTTKAVSKQAEAFFVKQIKEILDDPSLDEEGLAPAIEDGYYVIGDCHSEQVVCICWPEVK